LWIFCILFFDAVTNFNDVDFLHFAVLEFDAATHSINFNEKIKNSLKEPL
jgi:hypothetical protein